MTEEQIRTEVALLKQDTSYIKNDIADIKTCLGQINNTLQSLNKFNHDPDSCKKKQTEDFEKLKQNVVLKSDVTNIKNFLGFVVLFSSLIGAIVWGKLK